LGFGQFRHQHGEPLMLSVEGPLLGQSSNGPNPSLSYYSKRTIHPEGSPAADFLQFSAST
jgi:hypothetical protein